MKIRKNITSKLHQFKQWILHIVSKRFLIENWNILFVIVGLFILGSILHGCLFGIILTLVMSLLFKLLYRM